MAFDYENGEKCCKANQPRSNCRCEVVERAAQYASLLARVENKEAFSRQEVVEYIWRERLRVLGLTVEELNLDAAEVVRFCEAVAEPHCQYPYEKPDAETITIAERMQSLRALPRVSEAERAAS